MDLDFILFTPPKSKYSLVDFWGETIFIPRFRKREKNENSLSSFLNCYKVNTANEVHLTIDAALLQSKGTLDLDSEQMTEATTTIEEQEIEKYIPCLYLNSMVGSKFIIFYLHASGEDIKLSHKMLDLLRNLYQINVIAMEYSGYSIYKGKTTSEIIKEDSQYVYNYITTKLGFKQQNVIVIGRSIGTGIALQLMQKIQPGALVLISPFASVKSLAREFIGFLGQLFAKQTYDSQHNIKTVTCPTFFLHGRKDEVISVENSTELSSTFLSIIEICVARKTVVTPPDMTHSQFDFYSDLADPLREFLMHHHFNFYEPNQKGPVVPDGLFQFPEGLKL